MATTLAYYSDLLHTHLFFDIMNLHRIIELLTILVVTLAVSVAGSRDASAWNAPPRKIFGMRRKNINMRSAAPKKSLSSVSVTLEHQEVAPSENLLDAIQDDSSDCSYQNQRIIPASARAAVVAFASAAAIGTTRQALEMILP